MLLGIVSVKDKSTYASILKTVTQINNVNEQPQGSMNFKPC
jgi:hypothetical protein